MADEGNPRSVLYQVLELTRHISGLPHEVDAARASSAELILIKMTTNIRLFPLDGSPPPGKSATQFDDTTQQLLEALLTELSDDLGLFSEALSHTYLTHRRPRQQREALVGDQLWSEEV
jgi:uncharacterized alpha-E superfamily protein